MKSIEITRLGGPEVLQLRESPDPVPGPRQARVRVKAIGINFADILMRMGMYPGAPAVPFVPGYEACGVIDAVGAGAACAPGDRVVVPTNFGGYADTLLVQSDEVFALPPGRSFEAGAALTVNYLTAYEALIDEGQLQRGQRVLVHGAAGGVGLAAIQLAKILGAEVIGTASQAKHEALRRHGVAHCIDYRTEDFEPAVKRITGGKGVAVALDPIGGSSFRRSYRCLAPNGKLILYGFSAAAGGSKRNLFKVAWEWLRTPRFSPFDLMLENRGVIGLHLGRMTGQKEKLRKAMTALVGWWAEGKLEPVIAASFPLEEAGRAHAFIQERRNVGKVVLTVP